MGKILVSVLALICAFCLYLFFHLGMHKPVTFSIEERSAQNVLYKKHSGAYFKIVSVIEEVEKWAHSQGESCKFSFGAYLDNPSNVEEDRLRSHGGCFIDNLSPELISKLPEDYLIEQIPAGKYLVAHFEGSPSIGPYKVYPKAMQYADENKATVGSPTYEIYEILNEKEMKTVYLFPLFSSSVQ